MKTREFNKLAKLWFVKKQPLTDEQKHGMLLFAVRWRMAVHKSLKTPLLDMNWLHCMGYLYETPTLFCTCENLPKTS